MEFYSNGSEVGIAFSGITGFLLMFYLLFECISFYHTKTLFMQKIIFWLIARRKINKLINQWWEVKRIGLLDVMLDSDGYCVNITLERDIPGYNNTIIYERLNFSFFGKMKYDFSSMKYYDNEISNETKKMYKRDSVLDSLGIN